MTRCIAILSIAIVFWQGCAQPAPKWPLPGLTAPAGSTNIRVQKYGAREASIMGPDYDEGWRYGFDSSLDFPAVLSDLEGKLKQMGYLRDQDFNENVKCYVSPDGMYTLQIIDQRANSNIPGYPDYGIGLIHYKAKQSKRVQDATAL
jgi:hypothetical protein